MTVPARVVILDWGIGGLPLAHALREASPGTDLLYISDRASPPYGRLGRSDLAQRIMTLLQSVEADLVALACNAASAVLEELIVSGPVEGIIEHGIRAALERDVATLGVLAGDRVTEDGSYSTPLREHGLQVRSSSGQRLSALVERGQIDGPEVCTAVAAALAPLQETDAILLACTHYPALAAVIERHAPRTPLIDPTPAMARAIVERYHLSQALGAGDLHVRTTGCPAEMRRAASIAFGLSVRPQRLTIAP